MTTAKHREAREIEVLCRRICTELTLEDPDLASGWVGGPNTGRMPFNWEKHRRAAEFIMAERAAAHAEGREEMREEAAKVAQSFNANSIAAIIRSLPKEGGMTGRALQQKPIKPPVEGSNGQTGDDDGRSLLDLMREVSEATRREILRASDESNPKPPEAPKPETDFETWWAIRVGNDPNHYREGVRREIAEAAWQAAHTALSARLAEVERERDELIEICGMVQDAIGDGPKPGQTARSIPPMNFDTAIRQIKARATTAETALATAQERLAEVMRERDARIKELEDHCAKVNGIARDYQLLAERHIIEKNAAETAQGQLVLAESALGEMSTIDGEEERYLFLHKYRHSKARAAGKGTGS